MRRGFSLLEMMIVVVVLGIVAVSATPVLRSLAGIRSAAATDEVARRLTLARSHALSTGHPAGVWLDATANSIEVVQVDTTGGMPTAMRDVMGVETPVMVLPTLFPGIEINSVTIDSPDDRIWFGHQGELRDRNTNNTDAGVATNDAEIALTDGHIIRVRAISGFIETEMSP